jgi:hypothetical protein
VQKLSKSHFYKGIKVEGSEFTEHYIKGKVEIAHGKIAENLNINVIPTLVENAALDAISADIYAWQDADWEAAIKLDANDETATYFPTGKLIITPLQWNNNYTPSNFVLAWAFTIKALSPANTTEIYINAHTGDIIKNQSIARNNGLAETLYYGTQTIDTEWRGFPHNNHRLKTTNNGRNIHTKSGSFVDDNNFYWTSNETDNDTSTKDIVVADCETYHGGKLQNPNGTLIESEALKIEGLEEKELSIKVAPNPVRSQLNIQTIEVGEAYLYNSQGTLILQKSINQNPQLDLNDLPTGTYWLKIITNKESKVFPIIKL